MAGPRINAERLVRRNRGAALVMRRRLLAGAACALSAASLWAGQEWLQAIDWLRLHAGLCGGLTAVASAIQVARRRVLTRSEFARSWLAAVPIRPSQRWEGVSIETRPASKALAALLVAALCCGVSFALTRAGHGTSLAIAWAALSAGVIGGTLLSYAIPAPKPVSLPPGSRYVPHQKTRGRSDIRPSLRALGAWPLRQMFAWAQPKLVARGMMPILLMMGMGTTADQAMSVVAAFGIGGGLVLLWTAAAATSRQARRWLAPLPLRSGFPLRALLLPALAVTLGAGAVEWLLLLTLGESFR